MAGAWGEGVEVVRSDRGVEITLSVGHWEALKPLISGVTYH